MCSGRVCIKSVTGVLAVPRRGAELFPIVRKYPSYEVEILAFRDGHSKCFQSLACLLVLSREGDAATSTGSYAKCVLPVGETGRRTKT